MPAFDALQKRRGGKDFAVVALSADNPGPEVVTEFLNRHGLKDLSHHIGKGREIFDGLGMTELPTTVPLGRGGTVWGTIAGPAGWDGPAAHGWIDHAIGLKPAE